MFDPAAGRAALPDRRAIMPMPTVDEAYPSRYAQPEKCFGLRIPPLRIRDVTYEELKFGPRYYLELTELDGRPWSDGQLANIPPTAAKTLAFNFGPVPEGWIGHVVELSSVRGRVDGNVKFWWDVMPLPEQPQVRPAAPPSPPPRPEPPAANVRPGRSHQLTAAGNGQPERDGLDDLLPDDKVPDFDKPAATPAVEVAADKTRRPARRPRKER
jgi:hypothetical protein